MADVAPSLSDPLKKGPHFRSSVLLPAQGPWYDYRRGKPKQGRCSANSKGRALKTPTIDRSPRRQPWSRYIHEDGFLCPVHQLGRPGSDRGRVSGAGVPGVSALAKGVATSGIDRAGRCDYRVSASSTDSWCRSTWDPGKGSSRVNGTSR